MSGGCCCRASGSVELSKSILLAWHVMLSSFQGSGDAGGAAGTGVHVCSEGQGPRTVPGDTAFNPPMFLSFHQQTLVLRVLPSLQRWEVRWGQRVTWAPTFVEQQNDSMYLFSVPACELQLFSN